MEKRILNGLIEVDYIYNRLCYNALIEKKAYSFNEKFYSTLNTEVSGIKLSSILKQTNPRGKCYLYAFMLSKAIPNSTLCYGVLHSLDFNIEDRYFEVFEHAWVEKDEFVFDTTSKNVFNKEDYYKRFEVEKYPPFSKKYSECYKKSEKRFSDFEKLFNNKIK